MQYSAHQPIKTTLKEFLETGRIGPLAIGVTMEQVRGWIGETDIQTEPYPKRANPKYAAVGWEYGSLYLGFDSERLISLLFNSHYYDLPAFIAMAGYFPSRSATLQEFTAYLEEEGISYTKFKPLTFDFQTALIMGAEVVAVFTTDDGVLGKFGCSESGLSRLPNV